MKIKNKEEIKKILFITLSNIGDIILTMPVLAALKREFPGAPIDVMSGPNGKELFSGHPLVSDFICYDKLSGLRSKVELVKELRKRRYSLIVDLRKTLFPFLIGAKYRTSVMRVHPGVAMHKKDEHLLMLKGLGLDIMDAPFSFYINEKDEAFVENWLTANKIKKDFIVVSPGAKSHIKRWTKEGFARLCDRLIGELGLAVVMAGDAQDAKIISEISGMMKNRVFDLSGKLTLRQLGALIKRSRLLITNDSAPMHIGYAQGVKVLAIFGPTDPGKYGPKGKWDVVIRKDMACSPCEVAQCKKDHECMGLVSADEVFEAAKNCVMCKV